MVIGRDVTTSVNCLVLCVHVFVPLRLDIDPSPRAPPHLLDVRTGPYDNWTVGPGTRCIDPTPQSGAGHHTCARLSGKFVVLYVREGMQIHIDVGSASGAAYVPCCLKRKREIILLQLELELAWDCQPSVVRRHRPS
jgi:hypothetical protein